MYQQVLAREQSQARKLAAPAGGLRSGAQGTATSAMHSETELRAQRASAPQVHMRAGTKTASVQAK
eukprot:6196418-Pleurochrysis_carterae.AAC.1